MNDAPFSCAALVAKDSDPAVQETVELLVSVLVSHGLSIKVAKDSGYADLAGTTASDEDALADHCDLIIAVGGDGTMLRAAQLINHASLPLLGINRGRRGFLADVGPDDLEASIVDILEGEYLRESRMMLTASLRVPSADMCTKRLMPASWQLCTTFLVPW